MRHHKRQHRVHADQAVGEIVTRQEFQTGHLRGGSPARPLQFGRLPEEYRDRYADDATDPMIYVVSSNGTPIAWRTFLDGWFVPKVPRIPRAHKRVLDLALGWDDRHQVDQYEEVG